MNDGVYAEINEANLKQLFKSYTSVSYYNILTLSHKIIRIH